MHFFGQEHSFRDTFLVQKGSSHRGPFSVGKKEVPFETLFRLKKREIPSDTLFLMKKMKFLSRPFSVEKEVPIEALLRLKKGKFLSKHFSAEKMEVPIETLVCASYRGTFFG